MTEAAHRVTLGRISGAYGIKGWVKVFSFSRPLEGILQYPVWTLGSPGFETRVVDGRAHAGGVVAQLTNVAGQVVEDRNQAETLIGLEISVLRAALPKPQKGEIYWLDLIGMAVESSEGVPLGVVSEVTSNGAQDVLVVADKDAGGNAVERMIPYVKGPVIASVDAEARKITAHWRAEW